uniref:C2H2-type domain-containing protein n=1 Tax=Anopheles epiroticus TaxID=199890 RepID=A0A182P1H1_9DIPT
MTDQTIDPLRVYLTPDEILAEKIYICSFDNCFAMLHNLANLQMHLTRHHNAPPINLDSLCNASSSKSKNRQFYCPIPSCPYYQTAGSNNGARSFNSLRSLKQHYLKVHDPRNVVESVEPLAPVVCTETQTDFIDFMICGSENRHDPLLSYTHMYTQTYDDPGLVTDLGLSTTETQTSWNEDGETFGDYLVSTETQTNFDIDCFDCSSTNSTGNRTDVGNSKQTQVPEPISNDFHLLRGADFLSDIGDTIDEHASAHAHGS